MKKALLIMVALLVLLTGCGKKNPQNTEANTQTETSSETVGQITETETQDTTEVEKSETEVDAETSVETETAAETETQAAVHEHAYTEQVIKAPTCTQKGEKMLTCACGDSYTSEIETASHQYGEYAYNNDATQSADGTKSRSCAACGNVDTVVATGTKLPYDPYSLRAITSLDEIASVGTITEGDNVTYHQVKTNIEAGMYEKLRLVLANGDQFCVWNVRLADERSMAHIGKVSYYWFLAPVEGEFSDGYMYCNCTGVTAQDAEKNLSLVARNISGSTHESMINPPVDLPPAYQVINSAECPVALYEIKESENMITVWVESTNCGQPGIGTCGSFQCSGTCLRSATLAEFDKRPEALGWGWNKLWGENGRINWNGKLLVCFYYLKAE